MNRSLLNMIARLSIALLLFTQFVVAAYACRVPAPTPASAPCAHSTGDGESQADTAAVLDPAAPNLCLQHCRQGGQATDGFGSAKLPVIALPLITVVPPAIALPKLSALVQPNVLAHPTAPPPSLLFCVLRA